MALFDRRAFIQQRQAFKWPLAPSASWLHAHGWSRTVWSTIRTHKTGKLSIQQIPGMRIADELVVGVYSPRPDIPDSLKQPIRAALRKDFMQ
jgi:hypothetical protein